MKELCAFILVVAQITASIYLGYLEGWGGGLVFFIITSMLIGLMLRIDEIINRIFGDRN